MRLAHNIAEPQLSAREQADLVSELKHGLEEDGDDPAARGDIRQLLCMLRDRPDVAWRVRTDIESVLASVDAKSSTVNAGGVTVSYFEVRQMTLYGCPQEKDLGCASTRLLILFFIVLVWCFMQQ